MDTATSSSHSSPVFTEKREDNASVSSNGRPRGLAAGMTARTIVLGLVLSVLMSLWVVHASFVAHSSFLSFSHLPVAALFPFMFVVFVVNGPLKRYLPGQAFSPEEQLVLFFILFTASALPAWAFSTYWVAIPSVPAYYANSENRWVELFFSFLPDWLIVPNRQNAVQGFYGGLASGESIPWNVWVLPLGWWGTFFLALAIASMSLMVILRKQWVERERLTFPLVKVPMILVEQGDPASPLPRVAHNRLFWYGFIFSFGIICWNILGYWDLVPPFLQGGNARTPLILAQAFPVIQFKVNFPVIAICFFTELNILFSIWFFFLIATLQAGIMNTIGVPKTGEIVLAQHLGGFFMYTLFGLWMARHHLKDVFLKAIGKNDTIDDSQEFFSYRMAVGGVLFGLLYMVFFLKSAGMSWDILAVLLTTCMLLYIGVTRVVAEAGLINLDLPYNAHDFTVFSYGSANVSKLDLTLLTLSQTFCRNWRTLGMNAMAHLARVGDEIGVARKGMLPVMILALAAAGVTSVVYTLYLGYHSPGADQFTGEFGNARTGWSTLATWINNQTQLTGGEYTGLLAGVLIGWLLILCYHSFSWWPLHPIGWAVAQTWGITMIVTSIFIVWLIKAILLSFGGTSMYRKAQPFFIGLLVGYVFGVALSYGVDVIWFPNSGHVVETW
ncbi:MAG: hypothetical protein FJY97_16120 [candidate division Zixibacteria bacterium]|nr:hypothetical protein [candidate division Zixibacteria bacterium]